MHRPNRPCVLLVDANVFREICRPQNSTEAEIKELSINVLGDYARNAENNQPQGQIRVPKKNGFVSKNILGNHSHQADAPEATGAFVNSATKNSITARGSAPLPFSRSSA